MHFHLSSVLYLLIIKQWKRILTTLMSYWKDRSFSSKWIPRLSNGRFQKKVLKDSICWHWLEIAPHGHICLQWIGQWAAVRWVPGPAPLFSTVGWTSELLIKIKCSKIKKVDWTSAVAVHWVPGSSRAAPVSLIDRRWRWCCKPPRPNPPPPLPGAARLWSCRHVKEPPSLSPMDTEFL